MIDCIVEGGRRLRDQLTVCSSIPPEMMLPFKDGTVPEV